MPVSTSRAPNPASPWTVSSPAPSSSGPEKWSSSAHPDGDSIAGSTHRATLTVILPNYNHSHYLPRAVAALLKQERQADEIIIIDDASTDDSIAVLEELVRGHPTVRLLINTSNIGTIATLTRGLEAARGDYVYFAAADDWVLPGFFQLALDMLDRHKQAGLFCGEARLEEGKTGALIGLRPAIRPRQKLAFISPSDAASILGKSDNWILTGSAVFRRQYILEIGGFDPTLDSFADGYMARKVALQHGLVFSPSPVSTWCVFEAGLSRTTALDAEKTIKILNLAQERLESDRDFPPNYASLFERRWRFSTSRLALQTTPINRAVLEALSVRPAADRIVFNTVSRIANDTIVRTVMLGWLWLQLRPVSLFALAKTIISRYRTLRYPIC